MHRGYTVLNAMVHIASSSKEYIMLTKKSKEKLKKNVHCEQDAETESQSNASHV